MDWQRKVKRSQKRQPSESICGVYRQNLSYILYIKCMTMAEKGEDNSEKTDIVYTQNGYMYILYIYVYIVYKVQTIYIYM